MANTQETGAPLFIGLVIFAIVFGGFLFAWLLQERARELEQARLETVFRALAQSDKFPDLMRLSAEMNAADFNAGWNHSQRQIAVRRANLEQGWDKWDPFPYESTSAPAPETGSYDAASSAAFVPPVVDTLGINRLLKLADLRKNAIWWEIAEVCRQSGSPQNKLTLTESQAKSIAEKHRVTTEEVFEFFQSGATASWRNHQSPDT